MDVLLLRDFAALIEGEEFVYRWGCYPSYFWFNGAVMRLRAQSELALAALEQVRFECFACVC